MFDEEQVYVFNPFERPAALTVLQKATIVIGLRVCANLNFLFEDFMIFFIRVRFGTHFHHISQGIEHELAVDIVPDTRESSK